MDTYCEYPEDIRYLQRQRYFLFLKRQNKKPAIFHCRLFVLIRVFL